MESTITAVYENGVLRPLTPLELPEHARVRVRVEQVTPENGSELHRQVREALVSAGLSSSPTTPPAMLSSISSDRREQLAHIFAVGRPLSEIIIEERQRR